MATVRQLVVCAASTAPTRRMMAARVGLGVARHLAQQGLRRKCVLCQGRHHTHLMRNPLAHVAKNQKEMVAATVRTIFAQPDPEATRAHLRTVADTLQPHFPKVAELLLAAETDVTAYADFPGGPGNTFGSAEAFRTIMRSLRERLFTLPDDTWVYPGHGDDTTIGTERPSLDESQARGW